MATATSVSTEITDPSRIIGQVITGVGFLGAGVMLAKDGAVVGVTSAATIWILSAIGISISHANYFAAIVFSGLVVSILFGVDLLEEYSQMLTRGVHSKYQRWKAKPSRFIDKKINSKE
ncbi:hypothetical protein GCM10025767_32300 [Thalassotalea piscium]|uniref:Protein MgtC n=2 Tax=Thalassotalea piscium TaxID=1230533 RepID=A0A7X0NH36_9GAMM|nr:putative membrane protein YhiD involved in acid resistance [Thalassotalea piscium]